MHILLYFNIQLIINILVLEDDFMFDDKIKVVYDSINNFIIKKDGRVFSYLLGCLPLLQTLSSDNHSILLLSAGTHAVIYSFKMVEYVLTKDKDTISDWDIFMNFTAGKNS